MRVWLLLYCKIVIYLFISMSRFFCDSPERRTDKLVHPTILLLPSADGSLVHTVCETVDNPLAAMQYDDFALSKMLKNGVDYKSLQIQPDNRLGSDDVVNAFNKHLEEIADTLFETVELPKSE